MLKESLVPQAKPQFTLSGWQKSAVIIGVVALISLIGWRIAPQYLGSQGNGPDAAAIAAFEEQTGIRIRLIAVTGGGGLIDFRFKVLDVEKTTALFQNPENRPFLIVEGSDVTLSPPSGIPFDEVEYVKDRAYPILYVNQENSVQVGTLMTVVIGEFRLEHIVTQ